METACLEDVGTHSPAEEEAVLDSLEGDDADDYLDALLALGWRVAYVPRAYNLVPPVPHPTARHVHRRT